MFSRYNKISIVGLGYIGLPIAAVIASHRKMVVGIDINQYLIDKINTGNIHTAEPKLDSVVRTAVSDGFLRATLIPEPADVFIISVPTPFKKHYQPDLSFIKSAAIAIAPVLKTGNLVILESTIPVGVTEQMAAWLSKARPDLTFPKTNSKDTDINIAHCPERVLPGEAMREIVENDRVIGGITSSCSEAAIELYKLFAEGECITTTVRTAEMCKLIENSFRDVNIAFANELSILCDHQNINTTELIKLANRHPRVNILNPQSGVGGHCIPVDPYFIISPQKELARLISTAREVNNFKELYVCEKIINSAKKKKVKRIVVFGITYKPDIDDIRNSPALNIVKRLLKYGYEILLIEPNIKQLPESLISEKVNLITSYKKIQNIENCIVTVLVAHKEFVDIINELHSLNCLDFC